MVRMCSKFMFISPLCKIFVLWYKNMTEILFSARWTIFIVRSVTQIKIICKNNDVSILALNGFI